jgi:hypothetical protein
MQVLWELQGKEKLKVTHKGLRWNEKEDAQPICYADT